MYLDKTIAMFLQRVEQLGPNDCWPWRGMFDHCGYGRIYEGRRELRATHIALFLDGRPRPNGLIACHKCDNPPCVNPSHLWWGTIADNHADMVLKGRHGGGCRSGGRSPFVLGNTYALCKRTPEMIADCISSDLSLMQLARKHGVSKRTVSNIRSDHKAPHRPSPIKIGALKGRRGPRP